jgi:hypothetical protein
MAESLLEEQLERIKRLTEKITQVQNRTADLANEIARDRELLHYSPLHEVRDYRLYRSEDDREPHRAHADDAPRRRGRRRR